MLGEANWPVLRGTQGAVIRNRWKKPVPAVQEWYNAETPVLALNWQTLWASLRQP